MDWDRTHPIMRQIDFAKVTMEDAMRVRPLAAGTTLVEAVGGPLIYALEERDRKALFFGFDLFRSDFPLRVASDPLGSSAAPGRARSGEPAAPGGPADPAAGGARRDHRHRAHPVRAQRAGAGQSRDGELHRDRRGRDLHGGHRPRRDACGGEPHERR
jgi:hypothetical protein